MNKKIALSTLGICSVALTSALVSQHVFAMMPCAWCILQRLIFLIIAMLSISLLMSSKAMLGKGVSVMMVLLSGSGMFVAGYQYFVASHSFSCNMSLAEKIITSLQLDHWLPGVFAIKASCADAASSLFGLPYELWSAGAFLLCLAFTVCSMVRKSVH